MIPLHHDPHFTFRFAADRIIPRFHLEGIEAGKRVSVFKIDSATGAGRLAGDCNCRRGRLGGFGRTDHRAGRRYVHRRAATRHRIIIGKRVIPIQAGAENQGRLAPLTAVCLRLLGGSDRNDSAPYFR